MVYKCDPHLPIEIFKVVMYATDEYGNEKMLKQLEALVDEFKIPSNITMASHIGDQLSSMCKYLGLEYIPPQMKNVLLMTLKYLVD